MDSCILENTGSTARDFCMLERNILSHVKLALVFSLLSSSVLLRTRLVPSKDIPNEPESGLSLAILHVVASLAAIAAGLWEYYNGFRDMRNTRAFLLATKFGSLVPPVRDCTLIPFQVASRHYECCLRRCVYNLLDSPRGGRSLLKLLHSIRSVEVHKSSPVHSFTGCQL